MGSPNPPLIDGGMVAPTPEGENNKTPAPSQAADAFRSSIGQPFPRINPTGGYEAEMEMSATGGIPSPTDGKNAWSEPATSQSTSHTVRYTSPPFYQSQ